MSQRTLIRAIPDTQQTARQWTIKIDGAALPRVALVEISSRYGLLRYGWTAGGYDGWSYRETHGGGVVVVPFALLERELLIGVVEEYRPNQGGKVLNVPRGLIDPGESHAQAAARELREETGLQGDLIELDGAPMTPNSAHFETDEPGLGSRVFAHELPAAWLTRRAEHWEVSASRLGAVPSSPDRAVCAEFSSGPSQEAEA